MVHSLTLSLGLTMLTALTVWQFAPSSGELESPVRLRSYYRRFEYQPKSRYDERPTVLLQQKKNYNCSCS